MIIYLEGIVTPCAAEYCRVQCGIIGTRLGWIWRNYRHTKSQWINIK